MSSAAEPEFRSALTTSFIFHGVILLALLFGLPHMKPEPIEMVEPIAVDIMDIGPVTTTQVQGQAQVAKKNNLAPTPPLPAPAPSKPAPKPVATPPPAAPPKPVPAVKPDDQGALNNLIKSESKKAKANAKPDKAPDTDQQFGSLLKNLSKQKPPDTAVAATAKTPPATTAAAGAAGIVASHLTISEEDALRRQIENCWYVPLGAKDAQNLIIEIHLEVNPDRTVKTAEIVNTDRMSDPFFRAAAESARRAILNPQCSPLNLPEGKEEMWHSMTLRFNPQDVL